MQKVNHLPGKWWPNVVFSLIAVLVTVGDQLSKAWIRSNLALWQSLPETGFFRLIHLRNTGASFGLFRGYSFQLTIVAFFGVAVILFYAFFLSRRYPLLNNMVSKVALGLVLGGAIGNLIDRLRFGYVTDFFGVGAWPPFNVADSAITVGSAIFAGSLFYLFFRQSQETDGDEATSRKNSRFSK